jgi:hypothetical protein
MDLHFDFNLSLHFQLIMIKFLNFLYFSFNLFINFHQFMQNLQFPFDFLLSFIFRFLFKFFDLN